MHIMKNKIIKIIWEIEDFYFYEDWKFWRHWHIKKLWLSWDWYIRTMAVLYIILSIAIIAGIGYTTYLVNKHTDITNFIVIKRQPNVKKNPSRFVDDFDFDKAVLRYDER